MKHTGTLLSSSLAILLALLITGCAGETPPPATIDSAVTPQTESLDSSCSYFYFLWGSNAEYDERYGEALEAYEKAAICDPEAEYIAEKIPVLLIQLGRLEEAAALLESYIEGRPEKTLQRFILARLKIQQGQEDEAIELYRQALNIEPDNNTIRLRLGLLYSKKGEFEAAERIFKTILEHNEESYFALLYLARMYAQSGELTKAEQYYQQTLKLNWSRELSYEIADFYTLRKDFDKAQKIYQLVLERDKNDERAALGMVQTYLFLEKGESALQELDRIRSLSNTPERIDLVRSQILINLGENERAKTLLTALLEKNTLAHANYLLGIIYYEESHYEDADEQLRRIPPSAPEYRDALMLRVRILEESGESERAVEVLEKALASDESRQPEFFSWLAAILRENGKPEKASEVLEKGVGMYNENEDLLYEYAILQERVGNHKLAMELMEKILSLNLNHADALNFIGYSWADRNVKLKKAYEYISKALELKPNSGYILDSLGWIYYRLGELEKALAALEKAATIEPEDPYIIEHLGDIHRAMDNDEQALYYYRKSLDLDNGDEHRQTIREKIDAIQQP